MSLSIMVKSDKATNMTVIIFPKLAAATVAVKSDLKTSDKREYVLV